jgi:hypothetical protein
VGIQVTAQLRQVRVDGPSVTLCTALCRQNILAGSVCQQQWQSDAVVVAAAGVCCYGGCPATVISTSDVAVLLSFFARHCMHADGLVVVCWGILVFAQCVVYQHPWMCCLQLLLQCI